MFLVFSLLIGFVVDAPPVNFTRQSFQGLLVIIYEYSYVATSQEEEIKDAIFSTASESGSAL